MKKIISASDYVLYSEVIQRIEGNPFFEKVADNVYYFEGDDVTLRYLREEKNSLGSVVVYSDSREKINRFEKKILEMIGGREN